MTEIISRESKTKDEVNAAQLKEPLALNLAHTPIELEPLVRRIPRIDRTFGTNNGETVDE
jgi:hypothetical protein